jgi:hypothetical protein
MTNSFDSHVEKLDTDLLYVLKYYTLICRSNTEVSMTDLNNTFLHWALDPVKKYTFYEDMKNLCDMYYVIVVYIVMNKDIDYVCKYNILLNNSAFMIDLLSNTMSIYRFYQILSRVNTYAILK